MTSDSIKFLLVDDKEENLIVLEALLRRDGLEILTARSSAEALELLLVHEIALAFLDVQMPDIDGFELAELMRGAERTKHVPIIFVTAGARDPGRVFKGYESGAVDFLYKPIEPRILKSKADVFFELHRQKRELATSLRLNEMFVGILGHDLRNPLSAMLTGAQLLEKQSPGERELKTLRRMLAAGRRMTDMIEQLLDLTRARLGGGIGFVRGRSQLDVAVLVQRTVDELKDSFPAREVVVEHSGDTRTSGDGDRLVQLFSNLVSNALVHGKDGAPVRVRVDGGDRDVCVRVENAGAIPAELLPNLFDPFRGREGTSSRGLGLGLYIARQIAIAHGGDVEVRSSEEEGTAFTVSIPRVTADERGSPARSARSKKILIVDDDDGIRETLREALEGEGYEAATAANGREALELLAEGPRPHDVVILDLVLPVLDGGRVYQAMQANEAYADIPIIVSTANPTIAPLGALVVPKPLRLDRLLDAVAGALR